MDKGKILTSSSLMDDDNFQHSILFIAEYNKNGAIGFVVNKIFERTLNELVEFSGSPVFPLYDGGPVDKEHLYFIHRRNDIIAGGEHIVDDIYLGGDFNKAIASINNKTITTKDIKIFIGYCGWDADELEAEIEEGSWEVEDYNEGTIF